MNIRNIRCSYKEPNNAIDENSSNIRTTNPLETFDIWYNEAKNLVQEPNAMCLSTSGNLNNISSRFVLLKGFSKAGFEFYTNYKSRKAQQLEENNFTSAVFYWYPLHKSVRLEGNCTKLTPEENASYFAERCRGSQISAIISHQSMPIKDRTMLEELSKKYEEEAKALPNLTCPIHWGGYNINPNRIELWQGQSDRLHDRFLFQRVNKLINGDIDPEISREELLTQFEWSNFTDDLEWICQRLFP